MDKDKMYEDMIKSLKDTLMKVCEMHSCMEYYDGCMLVLEDIKEDAQKKLEL